MKSKIIFHEQNMEILDGKVEIVHYYAELMYVLYDNPYCWLYFVDNTKLKVESTLQLIRDNLPEVFLQCSRTTIINICYVKFKKIPNVVVMYDDNEFLLSRRNVVKYNTKKYKLPLISLPCPDCFNCLYEECNIRAIFCRRKLIG